MAEAKVRRTGAVAVVTPVDLGALVREARERRGWTQTDLGTRIGASRFWVAEFERGKAGAELGLALRAAAAVGLRLKADRPVATDPAVAAGVTGRVAVTPPREPRPRTAPRVHRSGLSDVEAIALDDIVGTTPGLRVRGASSAVSSFSDLARSRRATRSVAGAAAAPETRRETSSPRSAGSTSGRATARPAPQGE